MVFFFNLNFIFLCISFRLHCVFIAACGLPLVAVSRGYSLVAVNGLLIVVASLFLSTGSRVHRLQHAGSVVVALGPGVWVR